MHPGMPHHSDKEFTIGSYFLERYFLHGYEFYKDNYEKVKNSQRDMFNFRDTCFGEEWTWERIVGDSSLWSWLSELFWSVDLWVMLRIGRINRLQYDQLSTLVKDKAAAIPVGGGNTKPYPPSSTAQDGRYSKLPATEVNATMTAESEYEELSRFELPTVVELTDLLLLELQGPYSDNPYLRLLIITTPLSFVLCLVTHTGRFVLYCMVWKICYFFMVSCSVWSYSSDRSFQTRYRLSNFMSSSSLEANYLDGTV
jgi:hypothetical protein